MGAPSFRAFQRMGGRPQRSTTGHQVLRPRIFMAKVNRRLSTPVPQFFQTSILFSAIYATTSSADCFSQFAIMELKGVYWAQTRSSHRVRRGLLSVHISYLF